MIPADRPGRWVLVRRGVALVGCLVLSAYLTLPTCRVSPRAAAAPLQDAPTTQVISGTAPAPTTGTGTTGPGAATSATASTDADSASAALGDADALTRALDEGDYTALTQVVSERVAPHADGDAYATTLMLLGDEKALAFADEHGLAAELILAGNGTPYIIQRSKAFTQAIQEEQP